MGLREGKWLAQGHTAGPWRGCAQSWGHSGPTLKRHPWGSVGSKTRPPCLCSCGVQDAPGLGHSLGEGSSGAGPRPGLRPRKQAGGEGAQRLLPRPHRAHPSAIREALTPPPPTVGGRHRAKVTSPPFLKRKSKTTSPWLGFLRLSFSHHPLDTSPLPRPEDLTFLTDFKSMRENKRAKIIIIKN